MEVKTSSYKQHCLGMFEPIYQCAMLDCSNIYSCQVDFYYFPFSECHNLQVILIVLALKTSRNSYS